MNTLVSCTKVFKLCTLDWESRATLAKACSCKISRNRCTDRVHKQRMQYLKERGTHSHDLSVQVCTRSRSLAQLHC